MTIRVERHVDYIDASTEIFVRGPEKGDPR